MRVIYTAVVEEPLQRENLVQCIEILGGTAKIKGYVVTLECKGDKSQNDKFTSLFKQYPHYKINRID
ncbi:MAG: hypothetical protein Q4B87_03045 [Candidatus Saccharibacteria bacterium]|nr:hypothetical protein [Candidatus Saccharibacteria bacterium]